MSQEQKKASTNPYARPPEAVREPPKSFGEALKFLGPSFILIGSIVGSGELILTTNFGAMLGITALWYIILSCVAKTVIQAELGRYTIATGDTFLQAFDKVPGLRYRASWAIWLFILWQLPQLVTNGAILGAVGQSLATAFPNFLDERIWAVIVAVITVAILLRGRYELLEKVSLFLVMSFTVITIAGAVGLQFTESAITWQEALDGLRVQLAPLMAPAIVVVAASTFAGTGVGGSELIQYTYWCVEKGYARYAGEDDHSETWTHRARGWIKVMQVDVWLATAAVTASTVAFFLLGAGVLHRQGLIPSNDQMIETIRNIYTYTLGPWSSGIFLLGAFFVLYSTVFSSTAGISRIYADILGVLKIVDFSDFERRLKWIRFFIVAIPVSQVIIFLSGQQPKTMLIISQAANGMLIPAIAVVAIWLRYTKLDKRIAPNRLTDLFMLVCAAIAITISAGFLHFNIIPELMKALSQGG